MNKQFESEEAVGHLSPAFHQKLFEDNILSQTVTNLFQEDQTMSFLESSLARNLSELGKITSKLSSRQKSNENEPDKPEDGMLTSINDTTFTLDSENENPDSRDLLSLTLLQTNINNNLASLRDLTSPAGWNGKGHQILEPCSALHLDLQGINDSRILPEKDLDSERSRIGPEGGNTVDS